MMGEGGESLCATKSAWAEGVQRQRPRRNCEDRAATRLAKMAGGAGQSTESRGGSMSKVREGSESTMFAGNFASYAVRLKIESRGEASRIRSPQRLLHLTLQVLTSWLLTWVGAG